MHYARLDRSPRLQRLLLLLSSGTHYTTREIIAVTGICAVNSAAAELRANGYPVECAPVSRRTDGARVYEYWLSHQKSNLQEE
jgi:hypothetical protein